MSFSITVFGPKHYWWKDAPWNGKRAWFHRPDKDSTGGVGFCIPGLHVVFHWGRN